MSRLSERLTARGSRGVGTKPIVLLVDDDRDVLEVTMRLFTREGFVPIPCESLRDVQRAFRAELSPVAVVADLVLDGQTGKAIADWVRRETTVPVFLVSGWGNVSSLSGEMIIEKPLTRDTVSAIAREIDRRRAREAGRGVSRD